MRKKFISILLVLAMVLSLAPMAVFAADTDTNTAPVGEESVAVMVYGKLLADIVNNAEFSLDYVINTVKNAAQDALAGAKIPDVDMVLVSDEGYEYPLTKGGVEGATFATSFSLEADGMLSLGADAFKFVQDAFGQMLDKLLSVVGVEKFNQLFKVYGAMNVPAGEYTLQVRHIYGDGYKLIQPESGSVDVNVVEGRMNYVGYNKILGELDVKQKLGDTINSLVDSIPESSLDIFHITAGLKQAIEHVLKFKVVELKTDPQLMGALGAAEYARQKGLAKK